MRLMLVFAGLLDRVSVFVGKAVGVLYAVCIAIAVYEVVMRYGLDAPTQWTYETQMLLCATAWLLCVGYVTQQNRHITVTVMEILVSPSTWRRMQLFAQVVSLVTICLLTWAVWDPALTAIRTVERTGSAFNPPLPAILKPMLLVACTLYALQILANIARHLAHGEHVRPPR